MSRSSKPKYLLTVEDFNRSLKRLCSKHGYYQYFVMVGERIDGENSEYKAFWHTENEGMVDAAEEIVGVWREDVEASDL